MSPRTPLQDEALLPSSSPGVLVVEESWAWWIMQGIASIAAVLLCIQGQPVLHGKLTNKTSGHHKKLKSFCGSSLTSTDVMGMSAHNVPVLSHCVHRWHHWQVSVVTHNTSVGHGRQVKAPTHNLENGWLLGRHTW